MIFLFLRNVSATLIPSLALPISVIGTFAVMYLLDYSLDNLSLMALTLAVGFVVDDAIVMLENIVRHMEMGKPPMQAAVDGAAEVGFTILSMTISLTAVFIPILFLGGIVGRLFHEFAVTIAVSILVSGFVSLTLTPMLSSRFLKPEHGKKHGRAYQITEARLRLVARPVQAEARVGDGPSAARDGVLVRDSRRHGVLFWSTPKGFIPSQDTGQLFVTTETAQGTSFDDMVAHQQQVDEHSSRRTTSRAFGRSRRRSARPPRPNQGSCMIGLKPRDDAQASTRSDRARLHEARRRRSGDRRLHAEPAGDLRSAAARRRACISSRCRAPTSRRCTRRRDTLETRRRASRRCCRT